MAIYREITTKDDVPLSQLLLEGVTELELFNQAPRVIRDMLAQSVSEQTFRVYVGEMEWEELAEGEHARTGSLDSTEMAFSITKYGRSLGFSQEFIEDNPADIVRRQFTKLAEGALKKEHSVLLDVVRNGWANGSNLWYDPEPFGAYDFDKTHDHVYANTSELFGDANPYTPSEHLRQLAKDLKHHGKSAEIALVGDDFAGALKNELTWSASYHIPTFESLRTQEFPENGLQVDGMRVYTSAYMNPTEVHVIAASEKPLYFHERRPVQLTAGSNGGPVGDPGALIGSYGSARYGAVIGDPLAGVMVTAADNLA